jgi:hypothetical protein
VSHADAKSHTPQISSSYASDFWSLVGERRCADIEFDVAGDIVLGHSVILTAHSPRFMKVAAVSLSLPDKATGC